jgi:hypothetical protein
MQRMHPAGMPGARPRHSTQKSGQAAYSQGWLRRHGSVSTLEGQPGLGALTRASTQARIPHCPVVATSLPGVSIGCSSFIGRMSLVARSEILTWLAAPRLRRGCR